MADLEFDLWKALHEGTCQYGHYHITDGDIATLRHLSDACGGWIVFDETEEEIFIPLLEWKEMFKEKCRAGWRPLLG